MRDVFDLTLLIAVGWFLFAVIVLTCAVLRQWLERDTKAIKDAEEIDRNWP